MSIIRNWRLNADENGTSGLGKLKNLLTKNNMDIVTPKEIRFEISFIPDTEVDAHAIQPFIDDLIMETKNEINSGGSKNRVFVKSSLVLYHGVGRDRIQELLDDEFIEI